MDALKKIFPLSFGAKEVAELVIKIIIYVVVGAIIGVAIGLLAKIPVINLVTGIVGALVEIYVLAGIVITFLDYFKILK